MATKSGDEAVQAAVKSAADSAVIDLGFESQEAVLTRSTRRVERTILPTKEASRKSSRSRILPPPRRRAAGSVGAQAASQMVTPLLQRVQRSARTKRHHRRRRQRSSSTSQRLSQKW